VQVMDADEELYRRVRRGDLRAFDVLYARYEKRLFGFLLSQIRDRAEAEDAFHEVFLAALDGREVDFEGEGAFCRWIFRVARNHLSNQLRSRTRGTKAIEKLDAPGVVPATDETLGEHEMLKALDRSVAQLPESLAEVYHLRASGLRYEEMAEVLEMPLGTIKSRMHQLVTHLREELKPWAAT